MMLIKKKDLLFLIHTSLKESILSDISNMGYDIIYRNIILPEIDNKESKAGLPFRFMLNYLFGRKKEINNSFFKTADLNLIKELINKRLDLNEELEIVDMKESAALEYERLSKKHKIYLRDTGKIKIGISYNTYYEYSGLDLQQLRSIEGMNNKYWGLANSLGSIWAFYDPESGSIEIEDKYDFNRSEDSSFDFEDLAKISYEELPHAALEKTLRVLRDNMGVNEFKVKITLQLNRRNNAIS